MYSEPAAECVPIYAVGCDAKNAIDEVMTRGFTALCQLSYGAAKSHSRRWDSNPRHPAPEACTPTRQSIVSSSTRNRTWNFSLEARGDIRFTIEPTCPRHSVEPTERKARESNAHLYSRTALAVQPSKPYLATFRVLSGVTENRTSRSRRENAARHAMAMSSRWTMTPFKIQCRGSFENRTRSSFLPRTRAAGTLTNRLTDSDRRRDRTFDFLRVMQVSMKFADSG